WPPPACESCAATCCAPGWFPDKDRAGPTSGKHLAHFFQACHQRIRFFHGVVESKGCSSCGRDAKALHQRLGTVMAGSDSDPFLIEDGANIVRMDSLHHKREHP